MLRLDYVTFYITYNGLNSGSWGLLKLAAQHSNSEISFFFKKPSTKVYESFPWVEKKNPNAISCSEEQLFFKQQFQIIY